MERIANTICGARFNFLTSTDWGVSLQMVNTLSVSSDTCLILPKRGYNEREGFAMKPDCDCDPRLHHNYLDCQYISFPYRFRHTVHYQFIEIKKNFFNENTQRHFYPQFVFMNHFDIRNVLGNVTPV